MKQQDPLAHPLVAGLVFGGVFVIVFLCKCIAALVLGIPSRSFRDAEFGRVLLMLLTFSATTGGSVWLVRGKVLRASPVRRRNLATGLAVGATYSISCTLFFGGGMPLAADVGLGAFVFLGVAWAVASALNQVGIG